MRYRKWGMSWGLNAMLPKFEMSSILYLAKHMKHFEENNKIVFLPLLHPKVFLNHKTFDKAHVWHQ